MIILVLVFKSLGYGNDVRGNYVAISQQALLVCQRNVFDIGISQGADLLSQKVLFLHIAFSGYTRIS